MLMGFAVLCFAFGDTKPAFARTQLSKADVKRLFIGKKWSSPRGTFFFSPNGTYTYTRNTLLKSKARGPWAYRIRPDGTITSKHTIYRFFRKSNGKYEYLHGRSGSYVRVIFK